MKKRRIAGMITGGVALSLALFGGLLLADRLGGTADEAGATGAPVAASLRPVNMVSVTETTDLTGAVLRLSGQAEPGATVMLTDRGERVKQVAVGDEGEWTASLPVPDAPMAVEATLFAGETDGAQVSIRGVETVFRIHRASDREAGAPALIMVSAPAAPSRIVSSPFGGLPGAGPLYLAAIDYDDAGGVIFSGLSEVQGRVRLYVSGRAIGDTRVGPDGRWALIDASIMPLGEYEVRAELQPTDAGGERVSVSVPFERLPPLGVDVGDDGALQVEFKPFRWQVRRSLLGGGVQSTVIFRPEPELREAE